MIAPYEDLVAERIAIDSYREIIQYIGERNPTTRRIFEGILAREEEHADDRAEILKDVQKWWLPYRDKVRDKAFIYSLHAITSSPPSKPNDFNNP